MGADPTGLTKEDIVPFPGFGNPGLDDTIPLGLTSLDFSKKGACRKNYLRPATSRQDVLTSDALIRPPFLQ